MTVTELAVALTAVVHSAAYLVSRIVDHDIYAAAASKHTCIAVAAAANAVAVVVSVRSQRLLVGSNAYDACAAATTA
jgi:hypothetical protein